MVNNNSNSNLQQRHIFQHICKNELFGGEYDVMIKDDIIKDVFKIIKDYYIKYNKVPDMTFMKSFIKDDEKITENTISLLYNYNEYEKIYSSNPDWFNEEFDVLYTKEKIAAQLLKDIEIFRDGKKQEEEIRKQIQNEKDIEEDDDIENDLLNTPNITDDIYNKMPTLIKDMVSEFNNDREKDVFFIAWLSIISSRFNDAWFNYDGKKIYNNLYTFIVAPAASGKGKMEDAMMTLDAYKKRLHSDFIEAKKHYDYNKNNNEKDYDEKAPIEKFITIPANNSMANMIRTLYDDGGSGLIYQTEADSMVEATKQDWGNYSDIMRNAFHHEPITYSRIGSAEKRLRIDIDKPKLSICLSGTYNQVLRLIKSTENGLFSRFIYYVYKRENEWEDVFSKNLSENTFGGEWSDKILQIIEFFEYKDIEIKMKKSQQQKFNKIFSEELNNKIALHGNNISSQVFRNGLRATRIMMILSLFRFYEKRNLFTKVPKTIEIDDIDFEISMDLINILQKHAEMIFNNLIQEKIIELKKNPVEKIIEDMPNVFKKSLLTQRLKESTNFSESTIKRKISKLKGTFIKEIDRYTWTKIKNK